MKVSPIVLFVYNRPWHTEQTVEALKKNELASESDLFIFSDGSKKENDEDVKKVREYIKTVDGFKSVTIIEREKNIGLAESVITGVTEIVNKYGKVIVLEDDIATSKGFLRFMNDGLECYNHVDTIFHITGYVYPIKTNDLPETFLCRMMECGFGWATWDRAWKYFYKDVEKIKQTFTKDDINRLNFENAYNFWEHFLMNESGKLNTWAIFWQMQIIKHKALCLFPSKTFSQNIGFDNSGTNCGGINVFANLNIADSTVVVNKIEEIVENKKAYRRIRMFWKRKVGNKKKILEKTLYGILKIVGYLKQKIVIKIKNKTPVCKIMFDDNLRVKPISSVFGFDRGTPIDRYYIDKFLSLNSSIIKGTVLEIADDTYSKKFGQPDIKQEILHFDDSNKKATIVGDLTKKQTLPSDKVDCFICTQTFSFIFDVKNALEGSRYLLKDGGVLLATVSGISQISRYDMDRWGDYWRFTDKSIKMLAEEAGFSKVEVIVFGNVLAATAFLQGLAVEDLPDRSLLDVVDSDYPVTIGVVAKK